MKWVKQAVHYDCEDTRSGRCLGNGICTAILDSGAVPHPDLRSQITAFRDFTDSGLRDDSGHGTHVAGILAGNGILSSGAYSGMAPCSRLLICKVLDRHGNGSTENVLHAIDWLISIRFRYALRVVNISVGARPELDSHQKHLLLNAVEELWDLGLIVVVSSGNYGPAPGSVAVPGSSPKVITVGVPDSPALIQRQYARLNYSGRGPTEDCVIKPDVFAPGTGIVSCNSAYLRTSFHPYISKTGTSMATPIVSGAIVCLLSKYPDLTNVEVKLLLRNSCIPAPGTESGWGLLHVANLMTL